MQTTTNITQELRNTSRTTRLAALVGLALLATPSLSQAGDPAPTQPRASVEGSLDKPTVREVVRAHIDEVRECYNAELIEDGSVEGRIVVAFVVASDGHVREVEIASSTMPARFDACMAAAVVGWAFPVAAAETSVNYPFEMKAE